MNDRHTSITAFLDLSAAFDTLDHHILLKRLSTINGIQSTALEYISSHLSNRKQSVTVGSISSKPCPLLFGVPQGSVLGPILFTLYTQPLSDIIEHHHFDYHKFADDTELQKAPLPQIFHRSPNKPKRALRT